MRSLSRDGEIIRRQSGQIVVRLYVACEVVLLDGVHPVETKVTGTACSCSRLVITISVVKESLDAFMEISANRIVHNFTDHQPEIIDPYYIDELPYNIQLTKTEV